MSLLALSYFINSRQSIHGRLTYDRSQFCWRFCLQSLFFINILIFQSVLWILTYNLFIMFFPTYFIIFDHSSYFPLLSDQIIQNVHLPTDIAPIQTVSESDKENQYKKIDLYLQVYRQEIIKMKDICSKKCWTPFQDNYLLMLDDQQVNWEKVAQVIPQTNPSICKRRFYRLKQQLNKWPPELDTEIRKLHENTELTWPEIRKAINEKFCQSHGIPKFSTNKIKQRYNLYLRPGISKLEWSLDQDLQLIRVIKQNGRQWTKVIRANKILQNRTELQLKNRYFGTLKFLQKKVIRKVTTILKQVQKNNNLK